MGLPCFGTVNAARCTAAPLWSNPHDPLVSQSLGRGRQVIGLAVMSNCPTCNSPDNKVLDVRVNGDQQTRRRRRCDACGGRWTTIEVNQLYLVELEKAFASRPLTHPERKALAAALPLIERLTL